MSGTVRACVRGQCYVFPEVGGTTRAARGLLLCCWSHAHNPSFTLWRSCSRLPASRARRRRSGRVGASRTRSRGSNNRGHAPAATPRRHRRPRPRSAARPSAAPAAPPPAPAPRARPPPRSNPIPPNIEGPAIQAQGGGYCFGGPHPAPGGGWEAVQNPHTHDYAPFDLRLFSFREGCYYFVGDPRDFGYTGQTYSYYGAHPVHDHYGGGWCFMVGGHYHWWRPWSPYFTVVGPWYYWNGPYRSVLLVVLAVLLVLLPELLPVVLRGRALLRTATESRRQSRAFRRLAGEGPGASDARPSWRDGGLERPAPPVDTGAAAGAAATPAPGGGYRARLAPAVAGAAARPAAATRAHRHPVAAAGVAARPAAAAPAWQGGGAFGWLAAAASAAAHRGVAAAAGAAARPGGGWWRRSAAARRGGGFGGGFRGGGSAGGGFRGGGGGGWRFRGGGSLGRRMATAAAVACARRLTGGLRGAATAQTGSAAERRGPLTADALDRVLRAVLSCSREGRSCRRTRTACGGRR